MRDMSDKLISTLAMLLDSGAEFIAKDTVKDTNGNLWRVRETSPRINGQMVMVKVIA